MNYWEEIAKKLSDSHVEETCNIPTGGANLLKSTDTLKFATLHGTLNIVCNYIEAEYSSGNGVNTRFEIFLDRNTDLTFKLRTAILYDRILNWLFPSGTKRFISNFILTSSDLKFSNKLIEAIDFNNFRISSIQLKKENGNSILNLTVSDEFAKTRNADKYIDLIKKLAAKIKTT